jgi:hypothetical protein
MKLVPQSQLVKHEEPLAPEERAFLTRKERRDRAALYKVARVFLVLCFACSFLVACARAALGAPNPFAYGTFFSHVAFLMGFSGIGLYAGYFSFLRKVQRDLRRGTKTIERSRVIRKLYMPQTDTYFFYIDSPNRLSIEVSEYQYHAAGLGDEVNIEYTTVSKYYLGYY